MSEREKIEIGGNRCGRTNACRLARRDAESKGETFLVVDGSADPKKLLGMPQPLPLDLLESELLEWGYNA